MDQTKYKIMEAAMTLLIEKSYDATTTKDIAKRAGVNESTLFRKFKGKQDIVLSAMDQKEWTPSFTESLFLPYQWDLEQDLIRFARIYLPHVTTDSVRISIGLRSPGLYEHTASKILEIPLVFKRSLENYLREMKKKGLVDFDNLDGLSTAFLSMQFGFIFFKASFGDQLTTIDEDNYIKTNVQTFIKGIAKQGVNE